MLSLDSVSEADRFVRELTTLGLKPSSAGMYVFFPPSFRFDGLMRIRLFENGEIVIL